MSKFKVGDRVATLTHLAYGANVLMGAEGCVSRICNDGDYMVTFDNGDWFMREKDIELADSVESVRPVAIEAPTLPTLKFKRLHPDAVIPSRTHALDAGFDLTAIDDGNNVAGTEGYFYREYSTGLAIGIPPGHVGLIFPCSSISTTALALTRGILEAGYRDEVKLRFRLDPIPRLMDPNGETQARVYKKGDRIGQLVVVALPDFEILEVTELDSSTRGDGGRGNSGQ